jgi:hypothetical protein
MERLIRPVDVAGTAETLNWRRRTALAVLIFVPYLAAAVLLQALSGAFQGDFGQSSDEPAHATTALMICSNQPCSPDKH